MSERVWWTKGGENLLGIALATGSNITTLTTSSATIRIHYIKKDGNFTKTLSAEPSFPQQFHEALVNHVLQRLYAREGNINMAVYYKSEYRDALIRAKKHANSNLQGDGYSIIFYDQAR